MFLLQSPSSLMSPESILSAMPPPSPKRTTNSDGQIDFGRDIEEEEEKEVWSGDSKEEQEVLSGSTKKECDEIDTNEEGNEAIENCEDKAEEPKVGMEFDTPNEAYLYYSRYAKGNGFGVAKRTSKKGKDGNLRHVTIQCSRGGKARVRTSNPVKPRPQTKTECPARLNVALYPDGKWRINCIALEHNHERSPGNFRFYKSNRVLDEHLKRNLVLNDEVRIRMHKTNASLQIQAGDSDKLPYLKKDCHLEKVRRLRLVEGDAAAIHSYFMKMKADNSDFFYALDLNEKGRLRNVFWADARSRAACKEFGDVVTFDATFLVNKYNMPFASFVGVNHHGQLILLGCGLVSHEDTESFSWLFKTWMTCMWGCAPKAIITHQCMAMKSAVEEVFPNTRHRWCILHILKNVPEKLGAYEAYKSISSCLHNAVYDSLTIEEFEDAWDAFITKYELQSDEWLQGLYLERKQWVPAFVKDVFWAGMSSTQRSENMNSMNPYFDGYINSKTTLKQFVEQYENALTEKVESEKYEDMKSVNSYIPCITEDELEKQFKSVYTNAKVKEFHDQFIGKLNCSLHERKICDVWSEYEVKEWVIFGEEKKRKRVSFTVDFNGETNEANCNCRLFEFRGMLCRHQLIVFHARGVQRVPNKYVLKRWSKNVKRVHTKVRINYDNSSTTIEARRHDNMCNLFNEVVDLAEDFQEKYDKVMGCLRELKGELIESSVVCGSNMVSGTPNDSFSLGDGVLPSKQSTNILDPKDIRPKGRPQSKTKQGGVEKIVKKKREREKKTLSNEKAKVVEEIGIDHVVGTQESVVNVNSYPSYMGQLMWPNMMPYTMRPNMVQGRSILPFSSSLCPTGIGFNQSMNNFPSSQSNIPSLLNNQVWRGQSSITGSQVREGGQSSFLEDQDQG
ncbi:protein FAR1-RELATED SEQUENCE 6-like isoform X1 [Rhododendron vialii]|uniref:protein FAR1-RELATED SEQUENCE 6-like isoform X1 n=1 Tax=Rhododendron vialii TaxID=182163 RepID=UPI00265F3DDD|nr:protein FAR1-RELATED SEQUENCE 6-like isoform X1 [Rhododendron vialii]